jgi:hypothetical protein
VVGDPTLIALDRATALIATNEVDAGATLVVNTVTTLPTAHRTRLFLDAAGKVIDRVAPRHRSRPTVRACREALAGLSERPRPAQAWQTPTAIP